MSSVSVGRHEGLDTRSGRLEKAYVAALRGLIPPARDNQHAADFLADDYQLGRRIAGLGLRIVISKAVVETNLGDRTWAEAWRRQVRWARTIRVSRGGGYLGMPVTFATLWALAAAAGGLWRPAAALLALRMAAGLASSRFVLRAPGVLSTLLLMPLRDLWGAAVWLTGLFGREVVWRGQRLKLSRDGRIIL